MARSTVSVFQTQIALRQSYYWPEQQVTFWLIFMIVTGAYLIEVFARLSLQQSQLQIGTPWIIPFGLAVGGLTEFCAWAMLILIFQRRLIPGMVMLWTFTLLVLYVTGLIGTSIQLFGYVLPNCQKYVYNWEIEGLSLGTLAWLAQDEICTDWDVAFAFWVTGTVFLIWILVMSRRVVLTSKCWC